MALRYTDSFETYTGNDLGMHWYSTSGPGDGYGNAVLSCGSFLARSGGAGFYYNRTNSLGSTGRYDGYLRQYFSVAQATWIVGAAFYLPYSPDIQQSIISFIDSGTEQVGAYADSVGNLRLQRNGTVLVTAAGQPRWRISAWNYLEMKATINATTGAAELRLNGQTILTYSGNTQASGNASANTINFSLPWNSNTFMGMDDLYICDGTGTTNNDFLGDVRIQPLFPATSVLSQFTASGASANWLCVKEHAEDGDTTFVYTASGAQADLYGKDQLTGYTGGIPGIYLRTIVRKDDAGTRIVAPILTSGTATGIGPQTSLSNSYISADAIFETDPNTSAAWTLAALNAAAIGVSAVQ